MNTSAQDILNFDYCQLSGAGVTFYNKRPNLDQAKTDKNQTFQTENLTPGLSSTNGYISKATRSRIKKMVFEWVSAKRAYHFKNFGKDPVFVFLTLTLPAFQNLQTESDQLIKSKALKPVLSYLNRNGAKWLWKAEAQSNGNIHFHILTDQFLNVAKVRRIWSNNLGRYTNLINKYQAKHGRQTWSNGVDVDFAKNMNAISGYIAKYISKSQDPDQVRPIAGKLWGCSRELKYLKPLTINALSQTQQFNAVVSAVLKARNKPDVYQKIDDHYHYYGLKSADLIAASPFLRPFVNRYYYRLYSAIYRNYSNDQAKTTSLYELLDLYGGSDPERYKWPEMINFRVEKVPFEDYARLVNVKTIGSVRLKWASKNESDVKRVSELQPVRGHNKLHESKSQGKLAIC